MILKTIVSILIAFVLLSFEFIYSAEREDASGKTKEVTISEKNLIQNGSFEIICKGGKKAKSWGQGGGIKGNAIEWGLDSSTSVDGKYSYKLGKTLGTYASLTQTYGSGLLSEIKQPMLLSVWIKTKDIAEKPGQRPAFFGIYTHPLKGSNSGCIRVAKVVGTTDWKKYEKIISPELIKKLISNAKDESKKPYRWQIRANLCNQEGCMWIDKVELKKVILSPLKISLNSKEYWGDSQFASLKISIDFTSISQSDSNRIKVFILNNKGKEYYANIIKADKEIQTIRVPIKELPFGEFRLKVCFADSLDNKTYEKFVGFRKVKGPFE